jgi:hypothetical protein
MKAKSMKKDQNACIKTPCHSFECWFNFFSWRVLVGGLVFAALAQIIHTVGAFLTMSFYTDPAYFNLWSRLMMTPSGGFSTNFIWYSLGVNFFIGLVFASMYRWVSCCFCGQGLEKGLCFGWLLFLIESVPLVLTTLLLLNVPLGLLSFWLVESFIVNLAGGILLALIIK